MLVTVFFLFLTLVQVGAQCSGAGGIPVLSSMAQAIPSLRNMPGISFLPGNKGIIPENKELDSAIEQFSEPLVRFATGGQPVSSDIDHLISSIPNLLVNIPGVGSVDISKLPPQMIEHVLKGGKVPGVSNETLEIMMKQYMKKMYVLAANAQNMQTNANLTKKDYENAHKFLPALTKLPPSFVTNIMEDKSLPYLSQNETRVIKEYYLRKLQINQDDYTLGNQTDLLPPKLVQMLKLLPPGYNISKIPKEAMDTIMKGEMPDFSLLPADIITYIRENAEELVGSMAMPNVTVEEIMRKLPATPPEQPAVSPYDINKVDSSGVIAPNDSKEGNRSHMRMIAIVLLSFVGVVTVLTLGIYFYVKRNRHSFTLNTPRAVAPDDAINPIVSPA